MNSRNRTSARLNCSQMISVLLLKIKINSGKINVKQEKKDILLMTLRN